MGQDFRAMLGHSLTAEGILLLPARLNDITPGMATELLTIGEEPTLRWSWWDAPSDAEAFEVWFAQRIREDGEARVLATRSLWISVTPNMLEVGSWIRWRQFTLSEPIQTAMRSVCARVAALIGAESVYYLPDNACEESALAGDTMLGGGTIDQVAAALLRAGPPRTSIAQAADSGYFVERVVSKSCAPAHPAVQPPPPSRRG